MKIDLEPRLERLTEAVIKGAFTVSNTLGHGFLENVYRNALLVELEALGLHVAAEKAFPVKYRNRRVGTYVADLVVEDQVIVELKAVEALTRAHTAQVVNYLKASGLSVGLLLNFGQPRVEVRRVLP